MTVNREAIKNQGIDNVYAYEEEQTYVTMRVDGQLFGMKVDMVEDVLGERALTKIPLAPDNIGGALNLRGRIVTVINMRAILGLSKDEEGDNPMNIVIEKDKELYSLRVDSVGEVLSLPKSQYEENPATLSKKWRSLSKGVYRLNDELMLVFDVDKMIGNELKIKSEENS